MKGVLRQVFFAALIWSNAIWLVVLARKLCLLMVLDKIWFDDVITVLPYVLFGVESFVIVYFFLLFLRQLEAVNYFFVDLAMP